MGNVPLVKLSSSDYHPRPLAALPRVAPGRLAAAPPAAPALPAPIALVVRGREERVVAYACPVCGQLFPLRRPELASDDGRRQREKEAQEHCRRKCLQCDQRVEAKHFLLCPGCRQRRGLQREEQRFQEAQKLSLEQYPNHPVYWAGHQGSLPGGFFADIEELLDYCEDKQLDIPAYVWACQFKPFEFDVDRVIDLGLEGHHPGVRDRIDWNARSCLQAYLQVWCKERKIRSWYPDHARAVMLRGDDAA